MLPSTPLPIKIFASSLAAFHISEFILAAIYMRESLSWRSLLLSRYYCLAMLVGVLEYTAEAALYPVMKAQVISWAGLVIVILGEAIRKTAMVTAGRNFTHKLMETHRDDHELVCHGIYSWVRHPGYLGWMLWAVGTQLILVNPLCLISFAVIIRRFFICRVEYEESLLREFFPEDYDKYARKVPSGLPGWP